MKTLSNVFMVSLISITVSLSFCVIKLIANISDYKFIALLKVVFVCYLIYLLSEVCVYIGKTVMKITKQDIGDI